MTALAVKKDNASRAIVKLDGIELNLKSDAGVVHILKGITLELPAGKTVSVTGPSGSGKTTLLMVLSGLERPTSGTVEVAGKVLTGLSEDDLAVFRRDNIGIIFQNFHLIPTMTALENVAIPLEFAGVKDAFRRAEEALVAVGLKERVKHYPAQLSGGGAAACRDRKGLCHAAAPHSRGRAHGQPRCGNGREGHEDPVRSHAAKWYDPRADHARYGTCETVRHDGEDQGWGDIGMTNVRHPREGGDPDRSGAAFIKAMDQTPAFAGVTGRRGRS